MTSENDGDAEHSPFHALVGLCVTRWADIESSMFEICCEILQIERRLCATIFFRTPTIDARITLLDDLFAARCFSESKKPRKPNPVQSEWVKLRDRLRKHLPVRNFLAHHPVSIDLELFLNLTGEDLGVPGKVDATLAVRQQRDDRRRRPNKIEKINISAMRAHHTAASELNAELRELALDLNQRLQRLD